MRQNAIFHGVRSREVIAAILDLHFPGHPLIADLTWGKGAFWTGQEAVIGMDLAPQAGSQARADSRFMPLKSASVDIAVFDPPFMHQRGESSSMKSFLTYGYLHRQTDVRDLYRRTIPEMRRVARQGAIIKCSDIIESGKLNLNHAEIYLMAEASLGLIHDYAILDSGVPRPMRPGASVQHFRMAHSYFLVYKWSKRVRTPANSPPDGPQAKSGA